MASVGVRDLLAGQPDADDREHGRHRDEDVPGKARQDGHDGEHGGADEVDPRVLRELLRHVGTERAFGVGPRHDDARRHGDEEGRELRDEAVADREEGVGRDRGIEVLVVEDHAYHEAADEVDDGDEYPRLDVARDEFGGAVHLAVEVDLALDLALAADGLLLGDRAGVVLRVDGHLLARQAVQREAGRDFGYARRALRDDHHLHGDDDEEDDEADHEAVGPARADDEGREGPDHLHVEVGALGQDEAHRRDVEGEAEDGRYEEHGREDRELGRLLREQDDEEDEDGRGQVEGEEGVQEDRGHRDDDHEDDGHRAYRDRQVRGTAYEIVAHEALRVSHCRSPPLPSYRYAPARAASRASSSAPYTWASTAAMA